MNDERELVLAVQLRIAEWNIFQSCIISTRLIYKILERNIRDKRG